MPDLVLHDSGQQKRRVFRPADPSRVTMYVCGPTVYARAHIGNARPVVVFDLLFRVLRHLYGEGAVVYARNITDIDDKILTAASDSGRSPAEITAETTRWFHEDVARLGALDPTHEPRATEYIEQMVALVDRLVGQGMAYQAEGHVLFSTGDYNSYGTLSRRPREDQIAGARVEVAPYKRDPADFVLWKPSAEDQPGWESPWGRGRPGWHIECSAMSRDILGETFDIHAGGIDLLFPHHENECAQSLGAYPDAEFARYWLHNGHLKVEGEKMAKSLGNFVTIDEALRGHPGEVVRFALLSTHYRQPIDWSERKLQEANAVLTDWHRLVEGVEEEAKTAEPPAGVWEALLDDLNTPRAFAELHRLSRAGDAAGLLAGASMMGLLAGPIGEWARAVSVSREDARRIESLVARRDEARAARNYAQADAIRDRLLAAGIEIRDGAEGSRWSALPDCDPGRLEESHP